MHPELAALLRNARQQPEDDPARLVLADWLEEHGDERDGARAEFIRLQVRLARLHSHDPLREVWDYPGKRKTRARKIRKVHEERCGVRLLSELRGVIRVEFPGGLVRVYLNPDAVVAGQEESLARIPAWAWVDGFHIVRGGIESLACPPAEVAAFLNGPWAETRGYLHLSAPYLDEHLADALAESPGLEEVTCLDLSRAGMDCNFLRPLLASPHLANLVWLRMDDTHASSSQVGMLVEAASLGNLTRLDVYSGNLGPTGIEALTGASFRLTHLGVGLNNLGADGVQALLATPHAPHLRSLDLWGNGVGDRGAELLAASPKVAKLERLTLACNGIGNRGARALASSPYLNGLTDLHLGLGTLGDDARLALHARFGDRVR